MFLRMLRAVDDDVRSVHAAHVSSMHVKGAMSDDCVHDIMPVSSELVVSAERPRLATHALHNVTIYV